MRLQILQILQNLPDFENATQPSNHKGLRQNPKYQFIELRVPIYRTESTKKSNWEYQKIESGFGLFLYYGGNLSKAGHAKLPIYRTDKFLLMEKAAWDQAALVSTHESYDVVIVHIVINVFRSGYFCIMEQVFKIF